MLMIYLCTTPDLNRRLLPNLVEGARFEPAKAKPADLQSALVDRLSTPPEFRPSTRRFTRRSSFDLPDEASNFEPKTTTSQQQSPNSLGMNALEVSFHDQPGPNYTQQTAAAGTQCHNPGRERS